MNRLRNILKASLTATALLAPLGASAHPHIFIDGGLTFYFDPQGQLTQVRVGWFYDEFYSLLIAQDMGMDNDLDGWLTPQEEAHLTGFDAEWVEGYTGDLILSVGGQEVTLSGPKEPTAMMSDGRIYTTHLRDLETPLAGAISAKMFDPTHYTAYDMIGDLVIEGAEGCTLTKIEPDLDKQMKALQAQLAQYDPSEDPEELGFPEVGDAFATEIRVTCDG